MNRGELVYALAVRLRKKDTPGKLYKSSTKMESCFNKDQVSAVQKRVKSSDSKYFYWISKKNDETIINNIFLRHEVIALNSQFI